ncbi:MAG: translation elongation factor Ts [Bacteroidetes bacterium]|nr:translation elongation factor Ts [Bacteroidota bacterium]
MTKITATEVNNLRQITGAGMMDCKKALEESGGDVEKAIEILRKKGQKVASKRADKEAREGIVIAMTNDSHTFGMVVKVNCETDFVAKNADFVQFVNDIANKAIQSAPKSVDALKALDLNGRTIEENLTDQVGKIGEKIEINGYECIDSPAVYAYNHMGNKLATIVGFNKAGINGMDEIGKEIAMQVAAMNPVAVDKDDVDEKIIEKEIEIGKEQARQEGKPEEMLEKIALGKLNKFYKENTLLNQDFVRDTKKTVKQYLSEKDKDLMVMGFKRLMLGE